MDESSNSSSDGEYSDKIAAVIQRKKLIAVETVMVNEREPTRLKIQFNRKEWLKTCLSSRTE